MGSLGAEGLIWRPNLEIDEELQRFYDFYDQGLRIDVADHNGDGRADVIIGDEKSVGWAPASSSFNLDSIALQLPDDAARSTVALGFSLF